jgi:nucleoside-diphosphate-sugar epimerase
MPEAGTILITGATGLVGSHVAERAAGRGLRVVTLVREGTDARWLEGLGATVIRGDLNDAPAVARAAAQADQVVHCAARVGDWGPAAEYRRVNVEGLRNLLEAVRYRVIRRFVHLSSLGVYAARDHFGTDESVPPPPRHVDGYTQSKVEAEQLALAYQRDHGVPVVVLRPGFIYGPRDRTVLPKLLAALAARQVKYLGAGTQVLNTIGVHNLVDAIFLALEKPGVIGRVYNLTDDEPVSRHRFLEALADLAGLDRPTAHVPLWLARALTPVMEGVARAIGAKQPPLLTQARLKFLGLNLGFSVARARAELGYQPRVPFDEGIREAVAWARGQRQEAEPIPPPQVAAPG